MKADALLDSFGASVMPRKPHHQGISGGLAIVTAESSAMASSGRAEGGALITFIQAIADAMDAMVAIPGEYKSFGHDYRADTLDFVRAPSTSR